MYAQSHYELFPMSSVCPYACSVVAFALKMGGTIDPEFLMQCQIIDPKFQKAVDALKPVPLKFETPIEQYSHQEDLFLDFGIPEPTQFYDSWQFKQHNSWIGSQDQWNSTLGCDSDDIIIDYF